MGNEITLTKMQVGFIVILVLGALFFLGSYLYENRPEPAPNQLEAYKRAVYDSIVCQYSCELIEGESNGTVTRVPDTQCISSCLGEVRMKGFAPEQFSEAEILSDDLFLDIDTVIQNCKSEHISAADVNVIPDFSDFHNCVTNGLASFKGDYTYLNE